MKNFKRILAIIFCISVIFTVSGCDLLTDILNSGTDFLNGNDDTVDYEYDDEYVFELINKQETLQNGYFKLKVDLPKGWYWTYLDEDNLTEKAEESSLLYDLYAYESDYIETYYLVEFSTSDGKQSKNNLDLDIYIDRYYDNSSFDYFMTETKGWLDNNDNQDSIYTKVEETDKKINGVDFKCLKYKAEYYDTDNVYYHELYIADLGDGYFLNIMGYYLINSSSASKLYEKYIKDSIKIG